MFDPFSKRWTPRDLIVEVKRRCYRHLLTRNRIADRLVPDTQLRYHFENALNQAAYHGVCASDAFPLAVADLFER